jgi:hypothetical protein
MGNALGMGAIVSATENTVRWNIAPPPGIYTILVVRMDELDEVYKSAGEVLGGGGGTTAAWTATKVLGGGGGASAGIKTEFETTAGNEWKRSSLKIAINYQEYTSEASSNDKEKGIFIYDNKRVYFNATERWNGSTFEPVLYPITTTLDYVFTDNTAPTDDTLELTWISGDPGAKKNVNGTWTRAH